MTNATAPLELFSSADIAQIAGVTRQRISQLVVAKKFPPPDAVCGPREFWTRETAERFVEDLRRLPICLVCGAEYRGRNGNTWPLCPAHAGMNSQIRIAIDPHTHSVHQSAVRRWHQYSDHPAYETGSWPSRERKRWLNPGSKMESLVLEAREKGWPFWDRLPEEIRTWVAERHPRA